MAITSEKITLVSNRNKGMHRSVGKKFSVQIDLIDGSPPGSFPGVTIDMHKLRWGVLPSLTQVTNFLFMPAGECIPFGSIRGHISGVNSADVDYTVRTGNDAQ
jgi:hypothetical protein